MKSQYPFTLTLTKTFTAGHLAGLTITEQIGICSEADAARYIAGWQANAERNGWKPGEVYTVAATSN